MTNRFQRFEQEKPARVPLEKKRQSPKKTSSNRKFHTMKASPEAYEKFDILHMATGEKFSNLLDLAAQMLFDNISLENEKVAAMAALLHDYQKQDESQMSIDDFI